MEKIEGMERNSLKFNCAKIFAEYMWEIFNIFMGNDL